MTEPIVAAMTIPMNEASPRPATNPASGRITSDGMGGKTLSRATRKETPT